MPRPPFSEDQELQLLLLGGKGGVGKTTCAIAPVLRFSRCSPQGSFLLVSTDPAHSLADSMTGSPPLHSLEILELEAQESLATLKKNHYDKLREIASRGTFRGKGGAKKSFKIPSGCASGPAAFGGIGEGLVPA